MIKPSDIDLNAFTQEIHRSIPLSKVMGFSFDRFEALPCGGRQLQSSLPLAANINDKETAFGGSIATLSTLSGWALVTLLSREIELPAQVLVYHSEQDFTAAIDDNFYSVARLSAEHCTQFIDDMKNKKRAKTELGVDIFPQAAEAKAAARYRGKYLAQY